MSNHRPAPADEANITNEKVNLAAISSCHVPVCWVKAHLSGIDVHDVKQTQIQERLLEEISSLNLPKLILVKAADDDVAWGE